ncbi:MAG: hypothetical protein ACYS6I_01965 [Planctomycetota bacterium]|jgi:hypothetical protein
MKSCRRTIASVAIALLVAASINCVNEQHGKNISPKSDSVLIEFDIRQDMDLIRLSLFGGPPQFAIWLEEPVSGRLQTVFVTHRSGTGDWVGKVECPAALPRWFEVFKEETGSTGLPTFERPAADAVTGATPKAEEFKTSVEVPFGSKWICWIEMNQSGDFNEAYRDHDIEQKKVDVHFSGQPPLVYRGEITAIHGKKMTPKLYGESVMDSDSGTTIQPVSKGVTTAKDIFKSIEVRVVGTK